MKTMRLKSTMVSWIATIIAVVLFSGFTFGQVTASKTSVGVLREKAVINKDLAAISQQQERVKFLQAKCKEEHTAGIKSNATHCALMKANADLDKEKAYLKADKAELLREHQAFIDGRREAIKEDRAELKGSQKNLQGNLAKGNASAVLYTEQIVNQKYELKQNELALKHAITDRNADLLATNKKIKEVKGESEVTMAFENSWAKTQNMAMK